MSNELPKYDRTASNQRNARLSTGSRTAGGKAASSRNQLAQAQWRLNRAHAAETKVFDLPQQRTPSSGYEPT